MYPRVHIKTKTPKLVTFNVSGQRFEISQCLLDSHPETILTKSASERWRDQSESEIFIERDGEIFRHVLSYLRDGRVDLPITVPKKAFMSELDYFAFFFKFTDPQQLSTRWHCVFLTLTF